MSNTPSSHSSSTIPIPPHIRNASPLSIASSDTAQLLSYRPEPLKVTPYGSMGHLSPENEAMSHVTPNRAEELLNWRKDILNMSMSREMERKFGVEDGMDKGDLSARMSATQDDSRHSVPVASLQHSIQRSRELSRHSTSQSRHSQSIAVSALHHSHSAAPEAPQHSDAISLHDSLNDEDLSPQDSVSQIGSAMGSIHSREVPLYRSGASQHITEEPARHVSNANRPQLSVHHHDTTSPLRYESMGNHLESLKRLTDSIHQRALNHAKDKNVDLNSLLSSVSSHAPTSVLLEYGGRSRVHAAPDSARIGSDFDSVATTSLLKVLKPLGTGHVLPPSHTLRGSALHHEEEVDSFISVQTDNLMHRVNNFLQKKHGGESSTRNAHKRSASASRRAGRSTSKVLKTTKRSSTPSTARSATHRDLQSTAKKLSHRNVSAPKVATSIISDATSELLQYNKENTSSNARKHKSKTSSRKRPNPLRDLYNKVQEDLKHPVFSEYASSSSSFTSLPSRGGRRQSKSDMSSDNTSYYLPRRGGDDSTGHYPRPAGGDSGANRSGQRSEAPPQQGPHSPSRNLSFSQTLHSRSYSAPFMQSSSIHMQPHDDHQVKNSSLNQGEAGGTLRESTPNAAPTTTATTPTDVSPEDLIQKIREWDGWKSLQRASPAPQKNEERASTQTTPSSYPKTSTHGGSFTTARYATPETHIPSHHTTNHGQSPHHQMHNQSMHTATPEPATHSHASHTFSPQNISNHSQLWHSSIAPAPPKMASPPRTYTEDLPAPPPQLSGRSTRTPRLPLPSHTLSHPVGIGAHHAPLRSTPVSRARRTPSSAHSTPHYHHTLNRSTSSGFPSAHKTHSLGPGANIMFTPAAHDDSFVQAEKELHTPISITIPDGQKSVVVQLDPDQLGDKKSIEIKLKQEELQLPDGYIVSKDVFRRLIEEATKAPQHDDALDVARPLREVLSKYQSGSAMVRHRTVESEDDDSSLATTVDDDSDEDDHGNGVQRVLKEMRSNVVV